MVQIIMIIVSWEQWNLCTIIRGDDYSNLSSYFEAFEKGYDVVEKTGWTFATEAVLDFYISEMENKNIQNSFFEGLEYYIGNYR